MNIDKLHFFDNNGYNLNFQKNKNGYWEGTIYLPKVSVGLYANTTIYILEEISKPGDSLSPNNFEIPELGQITTEYCFPKGPGKIVFMWDQLNTFVDEFFMFNFDDTYTIKETSSLVYTPNDGPDCNTLIINKFDRYEIPLDNSTSTKALPVHVAFMANEKYDANTYNRTLVMTYNNETIARIKFYVETEEEDERLKIWNANLGYNITPEDTMIFYKSDIKEYRPDYMLLNEKRKELMMEGSNIYPYIGSYLAIINAIKFFGYDNLNIIEYWRCVNPSDENFGKIYHSSRYSLTKKETLRIGATNIILPNKDYKKINALALVYDINKPTGEIDRWELPLVEEQFRYTIEEALIKLFALRKKLNKEFMPGSSRIIDIIGEANYFGLHGIRKIHQDQLIDVTERDLNLDFDVYPKKYAHITDNEYFNRYILIKQIRESNAENSNLSIGQQLLSDISNLTISSIRGESSISNPTAESLEDLVNSQKCAYFENYYKDVYEDYTVYKAIENNDFYPFEGDEYDYYNDSHLRFTAKVILKCKMFENPTFENTELKFDCKYNDIVESGGHNAIREGNNTVQVDDQTYVGVYDVNGSLVTFGNIDQLNRPQQITWTITRSKDQHDEDLKNAGIIKEYDTTKQFTFTKTGNLNGQENYSKIFVELPYLGYYDVTMDIDGQKKTKTKCIKVEPYNIDMIGFYYDIRNLPKNMQYSMDQDDAMFNFIQDNIRNMTGWAVSERTSLTTPSDFSMPTYTANGEMINTGPYFNENVDDEWYLADNLTYEIARLLPLVHYTRYIRSGVDVKPYTWFLLGYEYSKIAGKINPHWTIKNNESTDDPKEYDGRYLTLLLKKEGNYTVTLDLEDKNGNKYSISRNIIVVSKSANYKLYHSFKSDYDALIEQNMLRDLNEFYSDDKEYADEP